MAKRESDTLAGPSSHANSSSAPAKRKQETDIIEAANALSFDEFSNVIEGDWTSLDHEYGGSQIALYFSTDLSENDLHICFTLIESTSRHDYEPSSFGWHPKRKIREMKEKEMRYLIARRKKDMEFEGFMSFMLTYDSVPAVPVVYIYEIHLTDDARGRGLAKHLMNTVELIARGFGVGKVMLTCFKSNTNARSFYKHLEYVKDVSSPDDRKTRNKVFKTDYVILSKDTQPEGAGAVEAPPPQGDEQTQVYSRSGSKGKEQANHSASKGDFGEIIYSWSQSVKSDEDGIFAAGIDNGEKAVSYLRNHRNEDAIRHAKLLNACIRKYENDLSATRMYHRAIWKHLYDLWKHMAVVRRCASRNCVELPDDFKDDCFANGLDVYGKMRRELDTFHLIVRKQLDVGTLDAKIIDRFEAHQEQLAAARQRDLERREGALDIWQDDLPRREKILEEREEIHDRGRQQRRARIRAKTAAIMEAKMGTMRTQMMRRSETAWERRMARNMTRSVQRRTAAMKCRPRAAQSFCISQKQ